MPHHSLRRLLSATTTLALVPVMALALTSTPASAAPLPAAYSANAHGDVVGLDVNLLTLDLAGVAVGHSRSTATSTATTGGSTATSANLDGNLAGTGLALGQQVSTAPPSVNPDPQDLLGVNLAPVINVGTIRGDTEATYSSNPATCAPADATGVRVLSDAQTQLAGLTLASLPILGTVADVSASQARTRTFLEDPGTGRSSVVSRTTTSIGDISLLGGTVGIKVARPVVLEARSNGTTGTASYTNPPSVSVTANGTTVNILPGGSRQINLGVLGALANLTVSVRAAQNTSSGATGAASTDAFLSIDLNVLGGLGRPAADVNLDLAPMSVQATAPQGGVECPVIDTTAPGAPVITSPAGGSTTNDTTPTFSGTAEPGSTVVVRNAGGTQVCTATTGSGGSWTCTPASPLPAGQATYSATATDAAGNTSPATNVTFTIDTATTIDLVEPASGSTTNDVTPLVAGTGEAGASVVVREGATQVCTATVAANGSWSCTPGSALSAGSHTLTATATDAAGNTATDTTTFTIDPGGDDTTPPGAPVITSPANGSTTDDATPTFSGIAEPGSTVVVRNAGGTQVCTATTGTGGSWTCTPASPLPDGEATYTATATDAAGNTSPEASVRFTVDTTAPTVPVITTPAQDSVTNDTTPEFTGTAEPGSTVVVRNAGGNQVCTDTTSAGGSWSCTPTSPLPVGRATYTATARDAAGNTSPAADVTFTIDTAAPTAPVITAPAGGSTTTDSTPPFSGNAEAFSTVVVEDSDGNEVCTAVTGAGGSWSCTPAAPRPDGEATYTATATDAAGNTSPDAAVTFTIDTFTTIDVVAPPNGSTTSDTTPELSGNAEPGSTVVVEDSDGNEVCTATAGPGGIWRCTPATPLPEGEDTYTATATDAVGNTATATTTFTIDTESVDTTPPGAPVISAPVDDTVIDDATPEFSGTAEPGSTVVVEDSDGAEVCRAVTGAGGQWSCTPAQQLPDGEDTFTATATDAAGNTSAGTDVTFTIDTAAPTAPVITAPAGGSTTTDSTPPFSGTAEALSTVVVEDSDGNEVCTAVTGAGGSWSCTPDEPLPGGQHTYTAAATDAAGNTSPDATVTFTVDTTAPGAPVITSPAAGSVTNDTTPTFSGTAEPGSTVVVRNAGGTQVCTATTGAGGSWTCTPASPLPAGQATYSATATDAGGNTSPAADVTFTIDATAPTAPVITAPAGGSTTTDPTPPFSGTAEPGSTVVVEDPSGNEVCTAVTGPGGSWTCTPTTPLPGGEATYTATATDAAGNTSPATSVTFTIDAAGGSVAPPVISSPAAGATVQATTPDFSGTGQPGLTVTVREGSTVLCTATVGSNGQWSCSSGAVLQPGPHTVSATQAGPAGQSQASTVTFTVAGAPTPNPNPTPTDPDGDGLTNTQEAQLGTDPNKADTDGDGLTDGREVQLGTDPTRADTDKDGLTDGQEVLGVTIRQAFEVCGRKTLRSITVTTDPLRADTDRDGLKDGAEVRGVKIKQKVRTSTGTYKIGKVRTNPTKKDSDRDGLTDKAEITGSKNKKFGKAKTDPATCDTDRGGVSDGAEVKAGANPADSRSTPKRPGRRTTASDLPARQAG
ncbi:Ig-like domain (group 3) [Nocardioides exalbidus]|uniref:Ig-like domain (Group 3) n=1 Tax=Nocardioides exalbidus TaxID=402596 RepID=A0A1H4XCY1_9ACTN|nr:Ig-like domain-containing protein [Nocardioides exalbidus]SED02758.1 Ig-like domain (group 3) [Nocardioides exalbidus]